MKKPVRVLTVSSLVITMGIGCAQDRQFFRVQSNIDGDRISLERDGVLSWSAMIGEGTYLVETTEDLSNWRPWIRGFVENVEPSVQVIDPGTPSGLRFVPGGYFTMGDDTFNTFGNIEHTVMVSPFYIGTFEVTVDEAHSVYQWAIDQGRVAQDGIFLMNAQGDVQPLIKFNHAESEIESWQPPGGAARSAH